MGQNLKLELQQNTGRGLRDKSLSNLLVLPIIIVKKGSLTSNVFVGDCTIVQFAGHRRWLASIPIFTPYPNTICNRLFLNLPIDLTKLFISINIRRSPEI
jgi:hypothetical protein